MKHLLATSLLALLSGNVLASDGSGSTTSASLADNNSPTAPNGVNYYPVSDPESTPANPPPVMEASRPAQATDEKDMKYMSEVTPRTESDAGPYVAAYGGANFAQDYHDPHINVNTVGIGSFHFNGRTDDGWGAVGGIKFGYNFASFPIGGDFRLQPAVEVDALYLGSHADNNYSTPIASTAPATGSSIVLRDRFESAAAFVNGLVRLKTGTLITPYVGIGVGSEYVNSTGSRAVVTNYFSGNSGSSNSGSLSSSEFDFAAQVIAGFDLEIAKHWDLFTEYKFITVFSPDLHYNTIDSFGDSLNERDSYIFQHLITAGLKYNF